MKMKTALLILVLGLSSIAQAKTIRATDLALMNLNDLSKLPDEVIVEFRKGDELPVSVVSKGDLIETTRPALSYVTVKRDFWLRGSKNAIEISFDQNHYDSFRNVLTGSLTANAGTEGSNEIANAINIIFEAEVKKQP